MRIKTALFLQESNNHNYLLYYILYEKKKHTIITVRGFFLKRC